MEKCNDTQIGDSYILGCHKKVHNRYIHMDQRSHKRELALDI